jgi:hypothetical protein
MTSAAITVHMIDADMRKASRCVRAVFGAKSNMKFWFILVLFHMNKLHPYKKQWRLMSANMLQKSESTTTVSLK